MVCFLCGFYQIVDELREQILKLRFPHRVQNKEATPKTKRKAVGHPSPSKSPSLPAPKPALSDRPCVVVLNKPLEKLLIRSVRMRWNQTKRRTVSQSILNCDCLNMFLIFSIANEAPTVCERKLQAR